ncbi:MAG: branched-chain amino acid ABC transporter permease [Lacisediminihabitans sp.]
MMTFSRRRVRSLITAGASVALVLFAALMPLLNITIPGVFPGPSYTPGTLQLLAYAMLIAALALSYHLLFGLAGMLSFGHALFFAAGAYGLGIVLHDLAPDWLPAGATFLVAILITIVLGTVLAAFVGLLSLRVTGISFAMVTLAFAQAGSVLVRRNPGGQTGGDESLPLDVSHVPDAFVGVLNMKNLYWLALAVLVFVYLVVLWVEKSRAGHVVAAARENELRVRVIGIRPYAVKLLIFTIAGTLATVSGMAFLILQSGVSPRVATPDFTLTLLVIVVLGGVGFRWGAILGAIVYTLLDQRLTALAGSDLIAGLPAILRVPLSQPLFILGTLFILVVMFLPGGIAGVVHRLQPARRTHEAESKETA